MGIHSLLIWGISAIWIGLEIWLVVRDKLAGKGKTQHDKGTRNYNFISIAASMTAAGFLNGISIFGFMGRRIEILFWVGFGIMIMGLAFRVWSIIVLGKYFRTTVELDERRTVVRAGPYRWIRHPSYSGLLLVCLGYGIALQSWLSLLVVLTLPSIALLHRIRVEERLLVRGIGNDYIEYQRQTKRLIPGIW
ncbi:MAG: isoprenylcysteine carboxylmethyltransferase family protein [Candidatus Kryptoniota bacterium]